MKRIIAAWLRRIALWLDPASHKQYAIMVSSSLVLGRNIFIPQSFTMYPNRLDDLVKLFAGSAEPLIVPAPLGSTPLFSLRINGVKQPVADIKFIEDT